MRTPTRTVAGLTVAAALVLSGCAGGDAAADKPTEASSPTPTADPTQEAQDEAFELENSIAKTLKPEGCFYTGNIKLAQIRSGLSRPPTARSWGDGSPRDGRTQ